MKTFISGEKGLSEIFVLSNSVPMKKLIAKIADYNVSKKLLWQARSCR